MEYVKYNFGYMYSERPGTLAGRKMEDDVSEEIKARRLQEIVDLQQNTPGCAPNGQIVEVLVEKFQKNLLKNFLGETHKALP
jgi:tRNA-2-methylthio-N6-dimethylallyladenosine synthase